MQVDRVVREGVHLMALLPPFSATNWNSEVPDSVKVTKELSGQPDAAGLRSGRPEGAWRVHRAGRRPATRTASTSREFLNEPVYTSYALQARPYRGFVSKRYTPADYVARWKWRRLACGR